MDENDTKIIGDARKNVKKFKPVNDGGEQPNAHRPTLKTRAKVEGLIAAGFNTEDIARYLEIAISTLYRHYKNEIEKTMFDKTLKLTDALYRDAISGDKQARDMWLRCRAKWANAKPKEEKERDEKITSLLEQLVKNTSPSVDNPTDNENE